MVSYASSSRRHLNVIPTPKQFLKFVDTFKMMEGQASTQHAESTTKLKEAVDRLKRTENDLELLETSLVEQIEAVQDKEASVELALQEVAKETGEQAEAQSKANGAEAERQAMQDQVTTPVQCNTMLPLKLVFRLIPSKGSWTS